MPPRCFRAAGGQFAASAIAIAIAAGLTLAHAAAQEANLFGSDLGLRGETEPLDEMQASDLGLGANPIESDQTDSGAAQQNQQSVVLPGGANYGKPKPPSDPAKLYPGRPKPFKTPLPALVPYRTSATAAERKHGRPPGDEADPGPTTAVLPAIPRKPKPRVDPDPFAPVGVDLGSLRLVPYVEVDTGYDSNPNQQSGAHIGSPVLRGETGFTLRSDWAVHQLTGELHAGYTDDLEDPKASSPDGDSKFDLRLDATRDTAIDFEARGTLATQSAGSPILGNATVSERPLVATVGGTAGVTQKFGLATLGLHGTIDRTDYSNATLPDGSILALSGDSYTDYGVQARAGYELTPGVIPFAELDADIRRHDQALDISGFARNSNGEAGELGTTFELTRLLTGEISGGYAERHYADSRLAPLRGPTFASSLVWSATPLTTVTLKGATTLGETTVAYASGAVTRTISLELAHQLLWNLKLDALGSYSTNTYQGVSLFEQTYMGTFSAEYDLSRSLVLKASVSEQRFLSTAAHADFTQSKFMLGVRVQR